MGTPPFSTPKYDGFYSLLHFSPRHTSYCAFATNLATYIAKAFAQPNSSFQLQFHSGNVAMQLLKHTISFSNTGSFFLAGSS